MKTASINSPNTPPTARVDLQGHRGARGARPENTLPAFIYCIEHRMTTIELDTHVTRDKQLIIHHDSRINPKLCLDTEGRPAAGIPVKDLTVSQLKRFDCGALPNRKFPEQKPVTGTGLMTLAELFRYARRHESENRRWADIRFNIEMKFAPGYTWADVREAARIVADTVEAADMAKRASIQSFATEMLPEIRKRNKTVGLAALFQPTRLQGLLMMLRFNANRRKIIQRARRTGADTISPHYLYADRAFVRNCHAENLRVVPWTVNETAIMRRLFKAGVDGIISDYPDRLLHAYEKWNIGGGA